MMYLAEMHLTGGKNGATIKKIVEVMTMYGIMNQYHNPSQFAPCFWRGNGLTLSYTFLPG